MCGAGGLEGRNGAGGGGTGLGCSRFPPLRLGRRELSFDLFWKMVKKRN